MDESFSSLLRTYRIERGLTQEALAERAGIGIRTLQELERGERRPHRETLARLVKSLNLDEDGRRGFEQAGQPSPRRGQNQAASPSDHDAGESHASGGHLDNFPRQLTSFIGREDEIRQLKQLIVTKRLVTLTGTGGCGKTRLAYKVATEVLADFPDGIWLVELAPLADSSLVAPTIAQSLGVHGRPDQPVLDVLTSFLRTRRALLLLDNCERLIDTCARVATALLQTCPRLTILTTSRQALRVSGEVQWRVPSLSTPNPTTLASSVGEPAGALSAYPAIQLFVERARAVQPSFALTSQNLPAVARICWQLDGLPLAIELAAARVPALSVESMANRLDQRFRILTTGSRVALPRQQTLRATVDWSFELLGEPERILFRRLAVFAGSFSLEAVERVCAGDGLAVEDLLPAFLQLVDQSLVEGENVARTGRFRLLETIREYARERLIAAQELDRARQQHRAFYRAWAKEAETLVWGAEQKRWLDYFAIEHDNLRAALRYCREHDLAGGLFLASYLHRFWLDRGHLVEGQRWLEDLLGRESEDSDARAVALNALGRLRLARGDVSGAISALGEGLALLRPREPSRDLAYALLWLGATSISLGDDTRAEQLIEEARGVARAIGNLEIQGLATGHLGNVAVLRGHQSRAREWFLESLTLLRQVGGLRGVAWILRNLAILSRSQGDDRQARALLAESLTLAWEIGHGLGIVGALTNLGILAQRAGHYRRAVTLFAAARQDFLPVLAPRIEGNEHEDGPSACRALLGDEAFERAWAAGQKMTLEQAVAYALEVTDGKATPNSV